MDEVIWTTVRLAGLTTLILMALATPLAWWLARSPRWWKEIVAAVAALPVVLPPTVLGFYLLIALAPQSPLMALLHPFGVRTLAFTFEGLVIGSVIYSLPFAVQPLRGAFEAMGERPMEVAATLRASPSTLSPPWRCRWSAGVSFPPPFWCSPTRWENSGWC